jgi:SAM-dependent methyltransferase
VARRRLGADEVWTDLPDSPGIRNKRFEGLYGRIYDGVIRNPSLRRTVFGAWGSADPLLNLEAFVADAVGAALGAARNPVLADVPCGGGVLLPLLAKNGLRGCTLEIDIALQMLQRAVRTARSLRPPFETVFLRSDALALPIRQQACDAVVSVNGLHVVPDPGRFLAELARITRLGGTVWLVTPVDNRDSLRSRAILAAANVLGVTPQTPPTADDLGRLATEAGLEEFRSYGGRSIVGRAYRRR